MILLLPIATQLKHIVIVCSGDLDEDQITFYDLRKQFAVDRWILGCEFASLV